MKLDKQEYSILKMFLEADDKTVLKEELVDAVWGKNSIVGKKMLKNIGDSELIGKI